MARLRFIRRARQVGFTLNEVRALLRLARGDGEHVRAEARGIVATHVADIRAKIADLQAMERVGAVLDRGVEQRLDGSPLRRAHGGAANESGTGGGVDRADGPRRQ